jgi:AraC-like DNA-binding protein
MVLSTIHVGPCRFEVATRPVPPPLRDHVERWIGYDERGPGLVRRREFPSARVVVILDFGGLSVGREAVAPVRGGFVAGLTDRWATTEHPGRQSGIQLDLTPIGAHLLFARPLSELAGELVSLEDVGLDVAPIAEAPDWSTRFDRLEAWLLARLAVARADVRAVGWAVRRIEATRGAVDMALLAKELGYSSKHVVTLFRRQVGVPPKRFARIVRFEALLRHLRRGGGEGWAELAHRFGYADQAHLGREVREMSGYTPTSVRSAAEEAREWLTVQ